MVEKLSSLVRMCLFLLAAIIFVCGLGLGAAAPHAAADPCGNGCGGGGNGTGPDIGGGSMFQPPQMPSGPPQLGNLGSYPGLDQANGISIYNGVPTQAAGSPGGPTAAGPQSGTLTPANGAQPSNYEGTSEATTTKLCGDWQSFAEGKRVPPYWCVCGAPHGGLYSTQYCVDCVVSGEAPGVEPVVPED